MAFMIPERPRQFKAESREDLMFDALEKLPSEYIVIHSFQITKVKDGNMFESEADFVVFHRQKGILCIEAKATKAKYEGGRWYYGNGEEMHSGGPFEQAKRNKYAIKDYMQDHGFKSAANQCKFLHAVWFPLVSSDYVRNMTLPSDAPPELILTEEALVEPAKYLEAIFGIGEHNKTTDLDETTAERLINEVFCPQFHIVSTANFDITTKRVVFHRLLQEQAAILDFWEGQKTAIINGVAGTGKTMIAVEKAKRHASRGEKVLFLCFNNKLKEYLESAHSHENIDYYTIAGYACSLARQPEPDYTEMHRVLLAMKQSSSFPYQHVIVDEGQDLGSAAIEESKVLELLAEIIQEKTKNGSFYVFYDKLQMVQAWKMPEFLQDADCKFTLYRNCRNTKNIARASLRPVTNQSPKLMENCIAGLPANMHFCESIESIRDAIKNIFSSLAKDNLEDLVILTCKTEETSALKPYLQDGAYMIGSKRVPFTTCRKFKGLEADAVILVDVEESTFTGNNGQNALLYYVGASRARLRLDVLTAMDNESCARVLDYMDKRYKTRNVRKEFAKKLNTMPVGV